MLANRRFTSQVKAGRSHYQYKNWIWDNSGKRSGAESVRPIKPECADLINTCYANPASSTETVYCLGIDLDAHRANSKWKTKSGKLKWLPIKQLLRNEYPDIFRYIFAVVRSTSGKGLAIYLAISPLELVPSTSRAQRAARALQEKLLLLFNQNGFGADPGALGLKRDFCNWRDPKKCVYSEKLLLSAVQADKTPVVRDLLRYLKPFDLNTYVKKENREGLLYPDLRAERKLATLYCSLYAHSQDGETTIQFTRADIRDFTGLSLPFLSKFLQNPPKWLATKDCWADGEWALTVHLDNDLTRRAHELMGSNDPEGEEAKKDFSGPLERPELVQDGSRNQWITKATLLLKHNGITEVRAQSLMAHQVGKIPNSADSYNCTHVHGIVASIYRNHQNLFGSGGAKVPCWLLEGASPVARPEEKKAPAQRKQAYPRRSTPDVNNFKEGGVTPLPAVLRTVSEDQCFVFDKNYYSLPPTWVGKQVQVFEWAGNLRVYDEQGDIFVFAHRKLADAKGKYQVHKSHLGEMGKSTQERFDFQLGQLEGFGPGVGKFAQKLVNRHGLFGLRRLWVLRGLVNQHGPQTVNEAADLVGNLRDLARILSVWKEQSRSGEGLQIFKSVH